MDRIAGFERLSPAAQKLLLARLKKRDEAQAQREIPPSPRRVSGEPFPLSFAQERLWFLGRLDPESYSYNVAQALSLSGRLDRAAMSAAFDEIVRRHESLRLEIGESDGRAGQRVREPFPVSLPEVDLTALPEVRRAAACDGALYPFVLAPYCLETGPHLRVCLLRMAAADGAGGSEEVVLILGMHHIVSDAWSLGIVVRELTALYTAFATGRPSPLPPLPIQYPDFADWQRQTLSGDRLEAELSHWREHLAGAPRVLDLPVDRPRPPVKSERGHRLFATLPAAGEPFARLSPEAGTTRFMVLLAAFGLFVSRLTGQEDLLIGTPVANRTRAEVEELIGFFVNTLVLRVGLRALGEPAGFHDLAAAVRRETLSAYAHQDLPFERLVEELNPGRDLSRSPLFQVSCSLLDAIGTDLRLPGLEVRPIEPEARTALFDLELEAIEMSDGSFLLEWRYSADLFEPTTISRWARSFETLLAAAAAEPRRPVRDLPLLPESERQQLLVEWSQGGGEGGCELLHAPFAAQARDSPDRAALAALGMTITYGELDRRVERLAGALAALGVGPEVRVGLALPRSAEMLVALLAILRAGGAYVPLDPDQPADRLAFALRDAIASCRPGLLLAAAGTGALLPAVPGVRVIEPAELEGLAGEVPPRRERPLPADLAAYCIYTSGSTGVPKGVLVPHAAAAAYIRDGVARYGFGRDDRVPLVSSITFDASLDELFLLLATGGTLLLGPSTEEDPERFLEHLATLGASVLVLSTAYWHTLAAAVEDGLALPQGVGIVSIGGERALPERWFSWRVPGVEVINAYGPTEATVVVASGKRSEDGPAVSRPETPVGRPLPSRRIYVADRRMQPLPVGVPGELLAGEGLARGYLDRPDLTARLFVPDPFSGLPGERLYRTGDLARHLPDGRLEVLGRLDAQVKIRGFRIELGEIEAALVTHPAVESAAVVAAGDAASRRGLWLAAFVVARGEAPADADLRAHLAARLTEAMLPQAFFGLDELPLTPNGKVDRAALVERAGRGGEAARPGDEAPRGAVEELLAGLWADLLEVDAVSRDDDFFSLGGHSLLATQLVARVRNAFGVELPQRTLFEAPTLAALAARIEQLDRGGTPEVPPPAAFAHGRGGSGAERPPLSFAQERLWLIDRVEPGSNAYNMPVALRLEGALDRPALAAAWSELVRRHESLRTRFGVERGVPFQEIEEAAPVPLPCIDLAALPAGIRTAEAARLGEEEGLRPFDLSRDPVLRVTLLALAEAGHDLLFTVHHIASDGWSNGVLVREMVALYGAFAGGRPSPLPPLPLSYADYARWQRATLSGERLERLLAFYREELSGLPVLELPTDRPRPAVPAASGALATTFLSAGLLARLNALCREAGVTLFMVLAAAFQAVVGRMSAAVDFGVGTPVAGRRFVELEGLIGFFVNTLVLRADLSGDPSGLVLLERVRRKALAAFSHQDVPFEKLVSELNPERSLTHTPLFQVMCILQNAPEPPVVLHGVEVAPLPPAAVTAKFDLTLSWTEAEGGLAGVVEYRPDLFDAATLERFLARMEVFLAGLAAEPGLALADLPLLPEAERRAVLHEWNAARAAPFPASFDELFFGPRALALDPAAPALVDESGELTRRELSARVFTLARALRAAGAGPDVRVAVCLPRSPEMVTAILGTLAAGAAYVPLDPSYPADRLAFMLEDSAAAVLLTSRELAASLPAFSGRILVAGEAALGDPGAASERPAGPAAQPGNLAYVCYTSGSTGRPKGVAMPRGALANLLQWQERDLPGAARALQFSPVSFDVSFQEIGSTWVTGGALVLIDEETRRDSEALLAHLERHRVERLFLPFVALRHLAEAAAHRRGAKLALRDVITAGEALHSTPAVVAFFRSLPGCRLHNHYGPTETHAATGIRLAADPAVWPPLPPVGPALANARILLLDPSGRQPVPLGSAGELYVGGAGLARGYLGRPDLTAERFVPDPWGPPGERLYRTGDLARFLPEGVVDLAGRADDQVKIRGIRIEPGEVETVLATHPGVRQAVVAAREDAGVRRLIAWFQPSGSPGEPLPSTPELRAWVGDRLPAAFVPAAFVAVESFPLTPSGKVNRRLLTRAPLEIESAGTGAPYAPPRGQTEELLAAAWGELLGIARVGRHDNFFESGGHSLLASQLVSRVRELFGREVPQRAVFEEPTLAGLAERIEAAGPSGVLAPIERLPAGEEGAFPLSFAQERLWMLDRLQPGQSTYNLPLALRLTGGLDLPALAASLTEVVRRHEPLRTTYHFRRTPGRSDGSPVQEVGPARPVTLPVVDLSGLPAEVRGEEGWWLAFEEAEEPFDLERGPVFRVCLLRLAPGEHALLWNVHHIASDGWSHGVMVAEVAELYEAAAQGRPARLPELPLRYVDYAAWQRRTLTEEVLAAGIESFRRGLEGCRPLALPTDHERPERLSAAGGSVDVRLSAGLTDGLTRLCRERGATLFMGVAAAFAALLSRLSGQTDFALGTVLAGRPRAELEGLLGFFINAVPVPIHLSLEAGFDDLLAGVRESALEAFAHQYVPFERLVEELAPERNPAETPIIQALCVLQNTPVSERELPGLALAPIALDTTTAKFDLTLSLSPGEELTGGLEFRTDLFEPETLERWLRHLETLLAAALADPALPLARLPLVPEGAPDLTEAPAGPAVGADPGAPGWGAGVGGEG